MAADVPEPLEDSSWLAVKGGSVEWLVRVLGLSDPRDATWQQGMSVVGGLHEDCPWEYAELVGVFITPLIRGWRLAMGHYLGAAPIHREPGDNRTDFRRVAGWCRRLSREFGAAHAFTDQAQMDWYSWILALDGTIIRQVVYDDGVFVSDRGQPSGLETRLRRRFRPDPDELRFHWAPDDTGTVPRMAGEVSVNPWRFGPQTRTVGHGIVAVTPWGREHNVVFRGLGSGA